MERQNRAPSSVHGTFPDMGTFPEFANVSLLHDAGPVTALLQRVVFPAYCNRLLLRLAHISLNHYAETCFKKDFVVRTKNLEWL